MKPTRLMMLFGLCFYLIACSSSDSPNQSSDQKANPQSSIRLPEIPSLDLGPTLMIKELPEGDYLLSSVTYTWAYPNYDITFQQTLKTAGDMNENDLVAIYRKAGNAAGNFGVGLPLEIHVTAKELAMIDLRKYNAGFDIDDSYSWKLDSRENQPFPDHIGVLLKDAKLSTDGTYQIHLPNTGTNYKIAIQTVGEVLFLSVSAKSSYQPESDEEQRYQLAYRKGESLGSEPRSVVIQK